MHALVHQGAAAVELPGAAPVAGVVVALAAPPVDRGDAGGQPAELAGRDGVDGHLGGRVEAVLGDDGDQSDRTPAGRAMISSVRSTVISGRLLDDHVLAGLAAPRWPPRPCGAGRGADHHDVDPSVAGQRLGQTRVRRCRRGPPTTAAARVGRAASDDRDQLEPVGRAGSIGPGPWWRPMTPAPTSAMAAAFADELRGHSCGTRSLRCVEESGEGLRAPGNRSGAGEPAERALRPRCGSSEKKPSKPSARSARIVSGTSPSPSPARDHRPVGGERVLDLHVVDVRAQVGVTRR